ncbi:MAG TPA: aldo/keto reductase [Bryobacteraceae bacterium]|nr:aldo/keto reductase [Bryobacteraceae bacterium]
MLLGRATPEATSRFAARHGGLNRVGFYRTAQGCSVSSIGIGTYLGERSVETDTAYIQAILAAIQGGVNVIDTSLNYRDQRSERAIGQAIIKLTQQPRTVDRDELMVCTKAGYLVRGAVPPDLEPTDIVGGMHSMAPAFLADQIERSRLNLGLETIDVFYLHNPETQFGFIEQAEFYARIQSAFTALEEAVAAGKIQYYGAATWEGFRKSHALSLTRMAEIAQEVGGTNHHFRFIQLPFNLAMPEAFTSRHELLDGKMMTPLEVAQRLSITVVSSATILQGKLAHELPDTLAEQMPGLETDAQMAIQFGRSTPGITTALVGMSSALHVKENLAVAQAQPLDEQKYLYIYQAGA